MNYNNVIVVGRKPIDYSTRIIIEFIRIIRQGMFSKSRELFYRS